MKPKVSDEHHPNYIAKTLLFFIAFTYLSSGLLQSIGSYISFSIVTAMCMLAACCLLSFIAFTKHISKYQTLSLYGFLILGLYAVATSPNVALSANNAMRAFSACLFCISLLHIKSNDIFNVAKYAYLFFTIVHSLTLVVFYLFEPERTTGLLDDYSQASMMILLSFLMVYPLLKEKVYFSGILLVMFCAYFSSFSRTANFLLLLVVAVITIYELKRNNYNQIFKLASIILVSLLFVYLYPNFINEQTVDRGGLSSFSTLNSRTIYWQSAINAFLESPFLGNGWGTYSWTGINETQPFHLIVHVHNDYLQILHDLGIFWFIIFITGFAYILIKYAPMNINLKSNVQINIDNQQQFLAWLGLISIGLYMSINFLINDIAFQIAIAILIADTIRKRQ